MRFADILREHWPRFVRQSKGFIPAAHWRAAEAVLSCRTPRRGGHVHYCPECDSRRYLYHSCNHRNCPQCGATDRHQWSANQESRLLPVPYYDQEGRILLRWKDSDTNQWQTEALDPLELIRRWLLHVLPKGFVAVRHYGWLSPAAHRAFARVRFLLGLDPVRKPVFPTRTPECPCCKRPMILLGIIKPVRGPPLSYVSRAVFA